MAYLCNRFVHFAVSALRNLRISFKYGLCGATGTALTHYAMMCVKWGDIKGAHCASHLSSKVIEIAKAKEREPFILFITANLIKGWDDPHEEVLKILDRAYKSGMESGDIENGLMSFLQTHQYRFTSGCSLGPLNSSFSGLLSKLSTYKLRVFIGRTMDQHLVVQHLIGTATQSIEVLPLTDTDGREQMYGYLNRLQLGVYFGDFKLAEKMAQKLLGFPFLAYCHLSPNHV